MRIILAALLLVSCVAGIDAIRGYNPDGTPRPLPEEMDQGRMICRALCSSYARDYDHLEYDGKCVCKPARNAKKAPVTDQT